MRTSNALRHIEHIASLSLAPHIAVAEMLRALPAVIPGAQAGFFWVGANGEVLDACAPNSASIRTGGHPGGALLGAAGTGPVLRFDDHAGFDMTVTVQGQRRAILSLRRAARAPSFTERERRMLRALAPYFGRALDPLPSERGEPDDIADRTGVVVARVDGRLLSADPEARRLLVEMIDQPLTPATLAEIQDDRLPHFLTDFLRVQARRSIATPAVFVRRSRWGVYRAQMFPQLESGHADPAPSDSSTHAIVLSRHLPRAVRIMRSVERFDLSPRERQAAFQLGMGADAARGAAALGVSIATWRSYVKRVYQRLGVSDRVGLLARLRGASGD